MDDMNAFERQVVGQIHRFVGPSRPVDDAAIFTAITATRSPMWRFQSTFSATKFLVAGAIVALFGGFLLSGVLTQQPSEDRLPAVGASASATAQAEPTEAASSEPEPTTGVEAHDTSAADLLPGASLVTEEVAPGVYQVLGDGVRDIADRVRQVAFDSEGDVWVELASGGKGLIIRLGEPGVSLELPRKQRGTLGMTAGGAPVVMRSDGVTRRFDGEAWRKTELSEYDACWVATLRGSQLPAVGADGACYTGSPDRDAKLVRIDADGTRTTFSRDVLGLGPEQNGVLHPVAGPDGSIWAAVFDTNFSTRGIFEGLARYDGSAWSFIPYEGDDTELCGSCFASPAVGRDGVVWFGREVRDDAAPVLSWDGESWGSYLQGEGRRLRPDPSTAVSMPQAWPNGDIWFGSNARWDGTTVSLAEPPIPWGEAWSRAIAPDGSAWATIDGQLYVVTPEAEMVAE